jgi:tetratricopeptide (TPR) repeat protein
LSEEQIELIRSDVDRVIATPAAADELRANAYMFRSFIGDDVQSCIVDYSLALELPGISASMQFELLRNRGHAYSNVSDHAAALTDYTTASEIEGIDSMDRAWALEARAGLHIDQQNFDLAIADYTSIIDDETMQDDQRSRAHLGRGRAYSAKGELDAAIDDLSEAISDRRFISRWRAYLHRGIVYEKQERFTDALADYTRAVEAAADAFDAIDEDARWDPLLHRARLHRSQGDEASAMEDFRAVEDSFDHLTEEVAEEVASAIEQLSSSPAPPE